MKTLKKFPIKATRALYKGQKVMSQLRALRSIEVKHRMCLEYRNIVDNIYNKYKIAGFIDNTDYNTLLDMYYTYVLLDRVDNIKEPK